MQSHTLRDSRSHWGSHAREATASPRRSFVRMFYSEAPSSALKPFLMNAL